MYDTTDPRVVRAARDKLQPIRRAVVDGDEAAFRKALFGATSGVTSGVISQVTTDRLTFGFAAPQSSLDVSWSLAEVCFHANRPDLLRIALEAQHPETERVHGMMTGTKAAWLSHLCSRSLNGDISSVSLGGLAIWQNNEATDAFLELAVEYHPECAGLDAIEANDPGGAARITQARMRLQLRQTAPQADVADATPPARRSAHRTV
jgi:hypothetical protein